MTTRDASQPACTETLTEHEQAVAEADPGGGEARCEGVSFLERQDIVGELEDQLDEEHVLLDNLEAVPEGAADNRGVREPRLSGVAGSPPAIRGILAVVLVTSLVVALLNALLASGNVHLLLPPGAVAAFMTVFLALVVFALSSGWVRHAWEERRLAIDAAVDALQRAVDERVLPEESLRSFLRDASSELDSHVHAEVDEKVHAFRQDTLREVEKIRIFFESLLEKHVVRIHSELRDREAEIEKLRNEREDDKTHIERLSRASASRAEEISAPQRQEAGDATGNAEAPTSSRAPETRAKPPRRKRKAAKRSSRAQKR